MASAATRARAPSGDDVRWQRAARPANTLRAPRCALQGGPHTHAGTPKRPCRTSAWAPPAPARPLSPPPPSPPPRSVSWGSSPTACFSRTTGWAQASPPPTRTVSAGDCPAAVPPPRPAGAPRAIPSLRQGGLRTATVAPRSCPAPCRALRGRAAVRGAARGLLLHDGRVAPRGSARLRRDDGVQRLDQVRGARGGLRRLHRRRRKRPREPPRQRCRCCRCARADS